MKRTLGLILMMLMIVNQGFADRDEPLSPIILSARASLDIPSTRGVCNELFGIGNGINVAFAYAMPFSRMLSVGVDLGYHLAPLKIAEPGTPSTLHLASSSLFAEFRLVFLSSFELCVFVLGGYYSAILSDDPSATGGNYCTGGGAGLSFRLDPWFSVGLQTSYNSYCGLHDHVAVLLILDVRFGD